MGGEVDYIVRNGYLAPDLLRYCNWPAIDILGAFIVNLTGLDIISLLSYTPLASQIIYMLVAFCIFNRIFANKKKVWVSTWIFIMANWLNQDYFSAQNGAFIIYITILFCLLLLLITQHKNKSFLKLTISVLMCSLVTYHILTPFVLLLNLFALYIISKFIKVALNSNSSILAFISKFVELTPNFNSLIIVLIVLYVSWQVYGADYMMPTIIRNLQNSLQSQDVATSSASLMSAGSIDHIKVAYFRLFCAVLLYLMSAFGAFHLFIVKGKESSVSVMLLILMISCLGMFASGGYGGEILIRVLLFSLLPISYFISQNIDSKYLIVFLIIFLIAFPVFHITSRYGNEQVDYTSPADIDGSNFFFKYVPQHSGILSPGNELFGSKLIEMYTRFPYKGNNSFSYSELTSNLYFCISNKEEQYERFFMSDLDKQNYEGFKSSLDRYNKIYTSRPFCLYVDMYDNKIRS
jgi:hypothetical protein